MTATPVAGRYPVDFGTAELLRDTDREDAWLLTVDGVAQSYVDLHDPTHLEFDYVRRMADVLDVVREQSEPLAVVHLGGGAATLARYVAATRPGSVQVVVEADERLADLVRRSFGTPGFRLRLGDARTELARLQPHRADVVVADVFRSSEQPLHTTTLEWLREVRRVLRDDGVVVVNVADGRPLTFARGQVATLQAAFAHVAVLGDPGVLRGRRFANLVLVASDAALPVAELTRRAAGAVARARVVAEDDLDRFVAGAPAVTDATARTAPRPPADLFG